jgi:predicted membrane channel-forming protein YqfA (hemolysin III family)
MKTRIKSWITSIIGTILMTLSLIGIVMNIFELREEKFPILSIIFGLVLGYVFLMGKDEWIKEIFDDMKSTIFKK